MNNEVGYQLESKNNQQNQKVSSIAEFETLLSENKLNPSTLGIEWKPATLIEEPFDEDEMKLYQFLKENGFEKLFSKLINGNTYIESLDQLKTSLSSSTFRGSLTDEELSSLKSILLK